MMSKNRPKRNCMSAIIFSYTTVSVIVLYAFVWLFMLLFPIDGKITVLDFLGGIKVDGGTAGMPLILIFSWLVTISIPVFVTNYRFQMLVNQLIQMQFSRFSSIWEWCACNYAAIWINSIIYTLIGITEWKLLYGIGAKVCYGEYIYILVLMPLYLLILSLLSIIILLLMHSNRGCIFVTILAGMAIVFGLRTKNPLVWFWGSMGMAIQFIYNDKIYLGLNLLIEVFVILIILES